MKNLMHSLLYCAPALLALLLLAACGPSGDPDRPRNVLLISLDTLRADRLGCYGYDRPTSPFLDRYARENTFFTNVTANSPWTLPSHATMLTGLFPHRNGVTDEWKALPPEVPTLASVLSVKGFRTAALVNSYWLTGETGLNRGFDEFAFIAEGDPDAGGKITDRAIEFLEKSAGKDRPFFLFVHYYETHSPYAPTQARRDEFARPYGGIANGTTEQLRAVREGSLAFAEADIGHVSDLYDAEIRVLDGLLERLITRLKTLGLDEETLVVITAGSRRGVHGARRRASRKNHVRGGAPGAAHPRRAGRAPWA